MKNLFALAVIMLFIVSTNHAAQPTVKSYKIEPTVASPGDSVRVQIEFSGIADSVKSVRVIVREYPDDAPRFELKPLNAQNTWGFATLVPWDAPIQYFHLDIKAVAKNGAEIVSPGFENNYTGKAGTIEFQVK
jgi:hypothetical protein